MITLKQCVMELTLDPPLDGTARPRHLRGCIGNIIRDDLLFHQHTPDGATIYRYPLIQYKIIGGKASILGIEKGAQALAETRLLDCSLALGKQSHTVARQEFSYSKAEAGCCSNPVLYEFSSPWLALNNRNFEKYQKLGDKLSRKQLLERILTGNLLSLSKGIGYTADSEIKTQIIVFSEAFVKLKGNLMLGFKGQFAANFVVPNFWGIGKSVSQGFGTVEQRC